MKPTQFKRPFVTRYFESADASGKKESSTGYAASIRGAKRNMAVRIVLDQYGLAVVTSRATREVLLTMRRTPEGLDIRDMKGNLQ